MAPSFHPDTLREPFTFAARPAETRNLQSMKQHRWITPTADEAAVARLHEALRIDPLLCRLLVQRGITTFEAARAFFRPSLDDLHDPFLMADMSAAVARLDAAVQRGERILLYGDYDVDGTTSVAMTHAWLANFHANLDYYLPDRDKEGYGVSLAGVEYARTTGCSLVVAIDCGIKAHAAVELARTYDIDFIVCDHHLPEGGLPASVANLDPKRPDCPYPFKELSGCGIAFKLAQAYAQQNGLPVHDLEHLLDFVAVSIACDIVPMTDENRIMAAFGLNRLNREPRVGLWALIQRCGRRYPLTISDLVFGLGPLINAAGRVGDAREAVKLMLSADKQSALDNAGALVERNRQRREVDFAMAINARRQLTEQPDWQARKSVVLFDPAWHKGIIGIAASRIAEEFHRPTVILTQSEGRAVGSARSVAGFDLYEALQQCEHLFYSYGGHAHAAGMQMPPENVPDFVEKFEAIVRENLQKESETPVLEIAGELDFDNITPKFWRVLRQFGPFGPHNMTPIFCARRVRDTGRSQLLANDHVRFSLRQTGGKKTMTGMGFGVGAAFSAMRDRELDVAFSIREENWRGETTLTLQVKDVREAE